MFHHRLKILIGICVLGMSVCLGRLWYLQRFESQTARRQIEQLQVFTPQRLPTLRGAILDRNEHILAKEQPFFFLQVNYELVRLLDERFHQAHIQQFTVDGSSLVQAQEKFDDEWADDLKQINKTINFCTYTAGVSQQELYQKIDAVNDRLWELGRFIYWRRLNPKAPLTQYAEQKEDIELYQVLSVDLREMHQDYSILELTDHKIVMAAQLEFAGIPRVSIRAESQRIYPFHGAASQIIGWVGQVRAEEASRLFSEDEYLRYLDGEVIGKHGIEKICEAVLRGRRGEVTYDRQKNEISRTDPQFGQNVQLTLDIILQQHIQDLLSKPETIMPEFQGTSQIAAVVLDAATADILAMVSLPEFDLNSARETYGDLLADPRRPLRNHTMEDTFPPGSTVKPLILLAGFEEQKITADEVISCSWTLPPDGWPKCLLQRKHYCHDARWEEDGQVNNARNAIRGSCNVYFSQLADRLSGKELQQWLWRFGYGRQVLGPCIYDTLIQSLDSNRLREVPGNIIFGIQQDSIEDPMKAPDIPANEKRWWGIGQGNLRVTVLQVANAYAILARRGIIKSPRIVIDPDDPMNEKHAQQLPIHQRNLAVAYDGMQAVVNERGGSAYSTFSESGLKDLGMTIYGKTGSTQDPECAWFAGFVTDNAGRAISLAVVVEGGQSGGSDAAPLACEIIRLCNEAGFIGKPADTTIPVNND